MKDIIMIYKNVTWSLQSIENSCKHGLEGSDYSAHLTAAWFSYYAYQQSPVVITHMLKFSGWILAVRLLARYTMTTTFPEHTKIKLTWKGAYVRLLTFSYGDHMSEYLYPVELFITLSYFI